MLANHHPPRLANVACAATADANVNRSIPSPCQSSHGCVVLFLIIPGLDKVAAGCAMLIGRLLQETMERALESENLLMDAPPSSRSIVAAMQKETATRLNKIKARELKAQQAAAHCAETMNGLMASSRFIEDVAERLYGEPLLSFVKNKDQLYFGLSVSDLEAGLPVVAAELKRLGFLELAEIGRYDPVEKVCRTYHPKNSATPLMHHCVEVLRGAGLMPQ